MEPDFLDAELPKEAEEDEFKGADEEEDSLASWELLVRQLPIRNPAVRAEDPNRLG